ncbi:acetyltransferase-like isoleucine patch superfamily enzyme [Mucilaginibacter frigoritolerans]|uniref:Acetyltransferase-like isoleucine patch superfamily enzyme n=2 Tax=Mucilaginibacter frigoritolerans TaxID=652788 RepID=A0A562UFM9_9SPHI|nr:acetyltransferase-like isoleucine patch superfamily enzyme [Mucilaginibacter frigoritolerans]
MLIAFSFSKIPLKTNSFFRFSIKISPKNKLDFQKVFFEKSGLIINGSGNILRIRDAIVSHSAIRIDGENNQIDIAEGVKLRSANITIRGNNCNISIGKNTTFGGIRIINAGLDNAIFIGENCLFADHIELWASDTHNIYNSEDQIINKEKPVFIGNNVWVGSRVIILKGTTINDGSIIGMGSLVVNDVPAKSISVGNPNKPVKNDVKWSL